MNTRLTSAVVRRGRSIVVAVSASLFWIGGVSAAPCYDFELVADTRMVLGAIGAFASLNNEGTVAFKADDDSGETGIFISNSSSFEPVALNISPSAFFGGTSINDDGIIAFSATLSNGWQGVFAMGVSSFVRIYSGSALSFPSINSEGLVVLSTSDTLLVGDGASLTALATVGNGVTAFGDPMINDAATAVVAAALTGGATGIVTADGRNTQIVADTTGRFAGFSVFPVINDEQVVAFKAALDNGSSGVFVADHGEITTVVTSRGAYRSFGGFISLNNHGAVAFEAVTDNGVAGIFTGANPRVHKVVVVGQPLFDSSVTELGFYREGLNDRGQVAFVATLADGTQSMVVANPVDGRTCQ
jgi:hypothetical protein